MIFNTLKNTIKNSKRVNYVDTDFSVKQFSAIQKTFDNLGKNQSPVVFTQKMTSSLQDAGMSAEAAASATEKLSAKYAEGSLSSESLTQATNKASTSLSGFGSTASTVGKTIVSSLGSAVLTIGKTIVSSLASAAISAGISALISLAWAGIEKIANATDDAIKKGKELKQTISDNSSSKDTNIETLNGLKDEYSSLSKGVNDYGENIGLTSDQFDRYKEIVSKVVEMNPELAKGYSEQNGYLVNQKTLLDDAIDSQNKYYQNQLKITVLSNKSSLINAAGGSYTNAKNAAMDNISLDEYGRLYADPSAFDSSAFENGNWALDSYKELYKKSSASAKGQSFSDYVKENFGLDSSSDTYMEDLSKLTDSYIASLDSMSDIESDAYKKLQQDVRDSSAAFDIFSASVQKSNQDLQDTFNLIAQSQTGYENLDANGINALNSYIGGITSEDIYKKDWLGNDVEDPELESAIEEKIRSIIKIFSDADIQDGINSLTDNLEKAVTTADYSKIATEGLDSLYEAIGGAKSGFDTEDDFAIAIGVKVKDDQGNIVTGPDQMRNYLNRIVKGGIPDNLDISVLTRAKNAAEDYMDENPNDAQTQNFKFFDELGKKIEKLNELNNLNVKSFTEISAAVDSYAEALSSLNQVYVNRQSISADEYTQLQTLGITESDLNAIMVDGEKDADGNTTHILKNAAALDRLIKATGKTSTAYKNLKSSQEKTKQQYIGLVKQLTNVVNSTDKYNATTKVTTDALKSQIIQTQQLMDNYAGLEEKILGTTNAFTNYTQAQENDSSHSYDSQIMSMFNELQTDMTNGEYGLQSFTTAMEAIVPESFFTDINDADAKIQDTSKYLKQLAKDGEITLDDDGSIPDLSLNNVKAFVNKGLTRSALTDYYNADGSINTKGATNSGSSDSVFVGSMDDFVVNTEQIKSVDDMANALGMTTEMVVALDNALAKYSKTGHHFLDDLGSDADTQISNAYKKLYDATTDLEEAKAKGAGGKNSSEQKAVDSAQKEIDKITKTTEANVEQYKSLKATYDDMIKKTKGNASTAVSSQELNSIHQQMVELGEPTQIQIDLVTDNIDQQVQEVQTKVDALKSSLSSVNDEIDALNQKKANIESARAHGALVGSTKSDQEKWASELSNTNKILSEKEQERSSISNQLDYEVNIVTDLNEKKNEIIKAFSDAHDAVEEAYDGNPVDVPVDSSDLDTASDKADTFQQKLNTLSDGTTVLSVDSSELDDAIYKADKAIEKMNKLNGTSDANSSTSSKVTPGATITSPSGTFKKAKANGGLTSGEHNTVVGELGQELVVDRNTGRYYTVGDNGTEMVNLPRNAIVYNAAQTKQLLSAHKTTRGTALVNGNAYSIGGGMKMGLGDSTESSSSSSSKSSSSSSSDWLEAFQKAYKKLQKLRDNDEIDADEYYKQLTALYEEYYDKYGKKSEENKEKLHDEWVSLYEADQSDLDSKYSDGDISLRQYLDQYKKLYQTFYGNIEGYAKELKDVQLKYAKQCKSAYESLFSAAQTLISNQISDIQDQQSAASDALNAQKDATDDMYDSQIKSLNAQIDAYNKVIDGINDEIDAYQDEINAIDKANEQRQTAIDLQKAQYELNRAENQRTQYTYTSDKGFVYRTNPQDVKDARDDLKDKQDEARKQALQDEIDKLQDVIDGYDKKIDSLNDQIDTINDLKDASDEYYDDLVKQSDAYFDGLLNNLEEAQKKWEKLADMQDMANAMSVLESFGLSLGDVLASSDATMNGVKEGYAGVLAYILQDNQTMLDSFGTLLNIDMSSVPVSIDNVTKAMQLMALGATQSSGTVQNQLGGVSNSLTALGNQTGATDAVTSTMQSLANTNVDGLTGSLTSLATTSSSIANLGVELQNMLVAIQSISDPTEYNNAITQFANFVTQYQTLATAFKTNMTTLFGNSQTAGNGTQNGAASGMTGGWFDGFVAQVNDMSDQTEVALTKLIDEWTQFQELMVGVVGTDGSGQDENSQGSGSSTGGVSDTSIIGTIIVGAQQMAEALMSWIEVMNNWAYGDVSMQSISIGVIQLITDMATQVVAQCNTATAAIQALITTLTTASEAGISIGVSANGPASFTDNAHVGGTALADGTGSWGLNHDENGALVGELGPELRVSKNGKYSLMGKTGAELQNLKAGDIVFNHKQTEQLFKYGKINSRGRAFASGTGIDGLVKTGMPDIYSKLQKHIEAISNNIAAMTPKVVSMAPAYATSGSSESKSPTYIIENVNATLPNIKTGDDAQDLINDLGQIAQKAIQRFNK